MEQFVQLRVNEIRSLICSSSWRHCPGVDNPADIPTRSIKCSELGQCELWRNGPTWLSEELQPNDELIDEPSPSDECLRELKKKPHHSPTALITEATGQSVKELINIATFSNYHRLLRVTVYVLRFVRKLKANVKRRADKSQERLKNSWPEEINEAETLWLKEMQTSLPGHLRYQDWSR
ncbi:Hypothetical predicted protein [Paramuricea clavata]|uniref:Uncharacterized protein n=1 Tax=Paramuricea clavata TaxID=317549 RepID=A0A6S7KIX2_PARCT|nr:Hypothetical predicted protein [Paramuricea clavata]